MENQAFASPGTSTHVTVVAQEPTAAKDPRHKNKNILRGLGITEIVIGSLSLFLAMIAMIITRQEIQSYIDRQSPPPSYYYYYSYSYLYANAGLTYSAQGIWCGILIIVCGILGVRVKNTPTKCMYIANMIMTIITAITLFGGVVVSGFAAGFSYFSSGLTAIHSTITLLLFVAFVLAIIHSAFCCSGVCYSKSRNATHQYVVNNPQQYPFQQAQYVMGPNGQMMTVINQPNTTLVASQINPYVVDGATAYPQVTTVPIQQTQTGGGGLVAAAGSQLQNEDVPPKYT